MAIEPPHPQPLSLDSPQKIGSIEQDEQWPEPAETITTEETPAAGVYSVSETSSKSSTSEESDPNANDIGIYSLAFDPDAPANPGVTRSAEWDQPGSAPRTKVPAPAESSHEAVQPEIRRPQHQPPSDSNTPESSVEYETVFDPLFGDEVRVKRQIAPAAIPTVEKSAPYPTPLPAPLARIATPEEADAGQVSKARQKKTETKQSAWGPSEPFQESENASSGNAEATNDVAEPTTSDVHVYQLNDAELNPRKPDPPPSVLFFEGVFNFPWRKGNWLPWFRLSLGFTLLALLIYFILRLAGTGPVGVVGAGAFAMAAFLIAIWTISYSGVCLLATVMETATGNDRVEWPQESWREYFFPSFKVVYYYLCAAMATYPLAVLGGGILGWQLGAFFLFPAFLFCGLASVSAWNFLHAGVLRTICLKWHLYFIMYVLSVAILGIAGTAQVYSWEFLWLVPVAGFGFAACWLIYSRLLGRMAMTLNEEAPETASQEPESEVKSKRKKRKKKLESKILTASGLEMSESVTAQYSMAESDEHLRNQPAQQVHESQPFHDDRAKPDEPPADIYALRD